jgi:hypothetical protein
MLLDLCIPLTMKLMALGHPLSAAQRIAAAIVIRCLVLYTIIGYCIPADEPERLLDRSFSSAGIHTETQGSAGCDRIVVDARRRTPVFLIPHPPVPA